MNDYKELIEVLNNAEHITLCGNGAFNTVLVERCYEAADAIEQLVKERDEAEKRAEEKCNTCKYHFETNWEWRGVQDE